MKVTIYYHKSNKDVHKDSHYLLKRAATELYGTGDYELSQAPGGKPFFKYHPEIHFSISHSGACWACAFADTEVGLDVQIEEHRHRREKIAARFFAPEEKEYLEKCDYTEFYDVWAAKEAYLKYTGEGLAKGLGKHSVVQDGHIGGVISADGMEKTVCLQKVDFQIGYHMWICLKEEVVDCEIKKLEAD